MTPCLRACLPGYYYYKTRYHYAFQGVCHFLKYWGAFVFLMCLMIGPDSIDRLPLFGFGWIAFQSLYDWFSEENDRRASLEDGKGTLRKFDMPLSPGIVFLVKAVVVAVCVTMINLMYNQAAAARIVVVLATCVSIFWMHNRLSRRWKLFTYFFLYMVKSLLVFAVFWGALKAEQECVFLYFSLLFNCTYLPMYIMAKRKGVSVDALYQGERRARLLVTPFIYKVIPLAGLALYDIKLLQVLGMVLIITAFEFFLLRRVRRQA